MNQKPFDSPFNDLFKVFWVRFDWTKRWCCKNYSKLSYF